MIADCPVAFSSLALAEPELCIWKRPANSTTVWSPPQGRQVVLGALPDSPFGINLLGHDMSLWDNVAVLAVFGTVMILLAMRSFSSVE